MLPFSEVMKAASEAGKAINEVGAFTAKARSEFPDLFRKPGDVEGLKNIESVNPARTEYPSMFEKSETGNIKYDDYGKAYRDGNDLLPNNDYSINGYKYSTDELGRVSSVEGKLHMKAHEGRMPIKDSLESIGKGYEKTGDDRGHLIGDQFGGTNSLENMILQKAEINRVSFRNFENQLAKEVKAGNSVYVKIEPVYDEGSRRPSDLAVQYDINGKQNIRFFTNT